MRASSCSTARAPAACVDLARTRACSADVRTSWSSTPTSASRLRRLSNTRSFRSLSDTCAVHLQEPVEEPYGIGDDQPRRAHGPERNIQREAERRCGLSEADQLVEVEPRPRDKAALAASACGDRRPASVPSPRAGTHGALADRATARRAPRMWRDVRAHHAPTPSCAARRVGDPGPPARRAAGRERASRARPPRRLRSRRRGRAGTTAIWRRYPSERSFSEDRQLRTHRA